MLGTILGLLTGLAGPLAQLGVTLAELYLAKTKARTDTELAQINQQILEAENRKAIIIAEAGNRVSSFFTGIIRVGLALGPLTYLLKVFTWDKVIGSFIGCTGNMANGLPQCTSFTTDPLDTNLWWVVIAVLAFYFAYDISARLRK